MSVLACGFLAFFAFSFHLHASVSDDDGSPRLNQIQMKGTHNSFHQSNAFLRWSPLGYSHAPIREQLADQGVRQLELDLHQCGDDDFCVYHIGVIDAGTSCDTLRGCLREIKEWSDENRAHHPIFVFLEPKDAANHSRNPDFFKRIERQILDIFKRSDLLVPDDIRRQRSTLREAVLKDGWPKVDSVRGKVVFVLLDEDNHRNHYVSGAPSLQYRLMFTTSSPLREDAAVLKLDNAFADALRIKEMVGAGYIVRTRADADLNEPKAGDYSRSRIALQSGAQIISTDVPAKTDSYRYWLHIPDGSPSRCNPVSAGRFCNSAQVESLDVQPTYAALKWQSATTLALLLMATSRGYALGR